MKQVLTPMLYIHIPFCVRKCQYCDFLSFPPACKETMERYLTALKQEILSYQKDEKREISSIFIGGGTPSLLMPKDFASLMETLCQVFSLKEGGEFTIESNPGTITREKAETWKKCGVNRVSMGVQSLDPELLKVLGRIHSKEEVYASYEILRQAGFENVNFDLMSGLPSQTYEQWMETLKEAISMGPEHLSCYSLILEEGTPFYEKQDEFTFPDEDTERRMYQDMVKLLKEHGYRAYEISNFAKEGKESRHNTGYWRRVPYYGLGLGASSLSEENVRYKNVEDLDTYINAKGDPRKLHIEMETLSREDQMEEFMFLGLRCRDGIKEKDFEESFGMPLKKVYGKVLQKHKEEGLLVEEEGRWFLSDLGVDLSNQVFVDFLFDE